MQTKIYLVDSNGNKSEFRNTTEAVSAFESLIEDEDAIWMLLNESPNEKFGAKWVEIRLIMVRGFEVLDRLGFRKEFVAMDGLFPEAHSKLSNTFKSIAQ